jgi:hypothetical protein
MKIFKPYEDEKPESRPNDAGNIMEPQYKERYDENGKAYLEKVGEVNTYEKIQSYRDECDVMSILSRYAAGDQTALARPGYYIDTSKLPQTYTEWLNLMNEKRDQFDALPLEVKKAFDMSFETWAANAGEEEWLKKMGIMTKNDAAAQQPDTAVSPKEEEKHEPKQ